MSSPPLPADRRHVDPAERVRALFEEHAAALTRHARRRSPHLADDVVSETFAIAVRRAADIPVGRELPWLYVVADHTMRNMMRGQRRAGRVVDALMPLTPVATDPVDPPVIGAALGDLSERERALLTMTAFEGLTAGEAADRMGIPYGSARNALVSGRRRLAVSLAALAAAMVVAIVFQTRFSASSATERVPGRLKASISAAGAIHQVALVRHRASSARADASSSARYERWSDPSGDRQRVVLPGGRQVTTNAGESLESAADRVDRRSTRRPISGLVREDLAALDVSSPSSLAALAADPAVRRSRGPKLAGHATTQLRGVVVAPTGARHFVEATVADGAPDVLRVVAQRLQAGRRVGDPSIVDFVQWTPVPPGPKADEALGVVAAPTTPTTPVPGAAAGISGTAAAAAGSVGGADAAKVRSRDAAATSGAGRGSAAAGPAVGADRLASGPILHVRQTVSFCYPPSCYADGTGDVWLELGGQHRTREVRRHTPDGPIFTEQWRVGLRRFYYRLSKTGRTHGLVEPLKRRTAHGTLDRWHGEWLQTLGPTLLGLRNQPTAVSALPPGPAVDGRPSVVTTIPLPMGFEGALSADVRVDPATGIPMEVFVHGAGNPSAVPGAGSHHVELHDAYRRGRTDPGWRPCGPPHRTFPVWRARDQVHVKVLQIGVTSPV